MLPKGLHAFIYKIMEEKEIDIQFMQRALALAKNAEGDTSPNPMVGCVIVRDGKIIGEGWHHKAGLPHAEIEALKDAKYRVQGGTCYVTLEPCSHYGKVGPCCNALANYGIKKVVCAMQDPNPKVAGQGFAYLKKAGVQVEVGLCQKEAEELNEKFLFAITHDRPFVSLKYAMTLDGKIATATGDSEWITNETARKEAHFLRKTHDCILVGIGTVLQDNPELTTRLVNGKNPVRVVLDSHLRLPLTAAAINDAAQTIIFVNGEYDKNKYEVLKKLEHVEIAEAKNLQEVLQFLHKREYRSVLVEGGAKIHGAFLDAGLVDRVYAFLAPKICGGQNSLSAVGGKGILIMDEAMELENLITKDLDGNVLLTARVKKAADKCSQD